MRKFKNMFGENKHLLILAVPSVLLAVIIAAQVCLRNSSTRAMFTEIEKYEDMQYKAEADISYGYLTIKLTKGKPSEKIELWYNGEMAETMSKKSVTLKVECDGVVEIKNDSGSLITAEVGGIDDNLELIMNNIPSFSEGIRVLCRVTFKE